MNNNLECYICLENIDKEPKIDVCGNNHVICIKCCYK